MMTMTISTPVAAGAPSFCHAGALGRQWNAGQLSIIADRRSVNKDAFHQHLSQMEKRWEEDRTATAVK